MSKLRWLLVLAAALALAVGVAACGGDDEEEAEEAAAPAATTEAAPAATEAAPAATETAAAGECPFEGGVIRTFQTNDIAGVAGDIGPSVSRAREVWLEDTNSKGGILGCEVQIDQVDEPFPDVDGCLRNWRDAIAQGDKYPFYMGAFNSACMAAVPDLTNAAGKVVIANLAADHQPFFEKFKRLNIHAAVSTFLEGRASAKFLYENKECRNAATIVPNYAYGQDAGRAFKAYFEQLGGKVVTEQFPEFDEDNFTPFINAIAAKKPDCLFSAFFGPFVVPFWKQWKASGNDDIPGIHGLIDTPTFEITKEADIPQNAYGYDRGNGQLLQQTPSGKVFTDLYTAKFGDSEHPIPSAWSYAWVSGAELMKAIIEKTQSLEPDAWIQAIEAGDFTFQSVIGDEPIGVNPVNHMANTCVQAGLVHWDESLPVPASYDLNDYANICMNDVLPQEEVRELTENPDVSDEALSAYYAGG